MIIPNTVGIQILDIQVAESSKTGLLDLDLNLIQNFYSTYLDPPVNVSVLQGKTICLEGPIFWAQINTNGYLIKCRCHALSHLSKLLVFEIIVLSLSLTHTHTLVFLSCPSVCFYLQQVNVFMQFITLASSKITQHFCITRVNMLNSGNL